MAGDDPRSLQAHPGKTPTLDGVISPGEWDDATVFSGVEGWKPQFSAVTGAQDLSLKGYVKHDGKRLYFAFDVTDDVLYGIDTPRWLPSNNPKAHELTREGFPWFGDEVEVLLNASNHWTGNQDSAGNGSSWQMVCNLTKSRKGGIGVGGMLEGEPRRNADAWRTYQEWILSGAQECAAKPKPGGKGYIIEWAVSFNPCLEVEPGVFYSTALGDRPMGLNILVGDLDEPERGADNPFGFHHENSFAGSRNTRTQLHDFGTLWMRAQVAAAESRPALPARAPPGIARSAPGSRPHGRDHESPRRPPRGRRSRSAYGAAAPPASFRPSHRRAPTFRPRPRRCTPSPRCRHRSTNAVPTTCGRRRSLPPGVPRDCNAPRRRETPRRSSLEWEPVCRAPCIREHGCRRYRLRFRCRNCRSSGWSCDIRACALRAYLKLPYFPAFATERCGEVPTEPRMPKEQPPKIRLRHGISLTALNHS